MAGAAAGRGAHQGGRRGQRRRQIAAGRKLDLGVMRRWVCSELGALVRSGVVLDLAALPSDPLVKILAGYQVVRPCQHCVVYFCST